MFTKIVAFLAFTLLLLPIPGQATMLDLTTAGSSGTIGLGYFEQIDPRATGTGVIESFVRIGAPKDVVQGYNTSGRPLRYDENSSPTFTHDLLLNAVPIVTIGGTAYRQFMLDINQQGTAPLLSLDRLRIYKADIGGLNPINIDSLGALVYDLDAGDANNYIKLNYNLNTGSGSGDMFAYIPDSLFAGGTYVYLYSRFGDHNANNDGFEEWSVLKSTPPPPQVPEPASLLLLGCGLLGLLGVTSKRKG